MKRFQQPSPKEPADVEHRFPVGAARSTPDSLLFGFGFKGIAMQQSRNAVMDCAPRFLLN